MAKDTDGLLLTASLDISKTVENIKENIKKLNTVLANDNSARVKIVGGLDLNKTQSLIQSQIATIGKNLKLNIGQIDTDSLNTVQNATQNITANLKTVQAQAQTTANELNNVIVNINTKNISNKLITEFQNAFDIARKTKDEFKNLFAELNNAWYAGDVEKYNQVLKQIYDTTTKNVKVSKELSQETKNIIDVYKGQLTDGSKVYINPQLKSDLEYLVGAGKKLQSVLSTVFGVGKWSYNSGIGFDVLLSSNQTEKLASDANTIVNAYENIIKAKSMGNGNPIFTKDGVEIIENEVRAILNLKNEYIDLNGIKHTYVEGFGWFEEVTGESEKVVTSLNNIQTEANETLTSTNAQVLSFKQSLQALGMNDDSINSVINRIERLNVEVTSLSQSLSTTTGKNGKSILNVEVSGVDKLGQAVKFTQLLDAETGNLIKQIDGVATASIKSASQLDNLMAQQIKRRADLANQASQIYDSAIDPNASRSITGDAKLTELKEQYKAINSAIERMNGTTKTAFAESEAEATKLIAKLKSTVQEYRNAENVSTTLKPDKLASAISKAESEFEALNTKIKNATVTSSEKLKASLGEIETILNKPKNGEVINKAEIEQVFTALSKAKSELNALVNAKTSNSAVEKVKIQAEALSNELNTFASKNAGFNTFKQTINETVVSVNSLQNALKDVKSATDLSKIKAQFSALKSAFNSSSTTVEKYSNSIDKAASNLNKLLNNSTFLKNSSNPQVSEVKKQISDLISEYQTLKNTLQGNLTPDDIQNVITKFNELDKQFKQVTTSANVLKTSISADNTMSKQSQQAELLTQRVKKLTAEIKAYKDFNVKAMQSSKLTSNGKTFSQEIENMILQLSHCANNDDFQKIAANFRNIKAEAKSLGLTGGTIFTNLWANLKKFSSWMSLTSLVSTFVMDVRNAITELKEIDTILTEISKTSDLTTEALAKLGKTSFDTASKYGRKASDYLTGVQEMYRAGFQNAPEMSELSILAQAAGDLTTDAANDYLIATDAAYSFKGSIEKLNAVLDSQNYITNNAAVAMQDMADATSEAASVAAQYGVDIDELSALIAVAVSKTRESGSEVGNALKALFINLQDTTSKPIQDAFAAVNISMTEMVDGAEKLKTPIELIKELSKAFTSLDEGDTRRANILSDIGGKYHANTLAAILSDLDSYYQMLDYYSKGQGSAAKEAQKTAESWEGMFNALENDWTEFVNEFANSDLFKSLIESAERLIDILSDASSPLNYLLKQVANLLELVTKLTDTIGLIPTIFAGLSLKNVGELNLKYARSYATTDIKHRKCNTF